MSVKIKKAIDKQISEAYRVHFDRVQVPMLDLPKIMDRARQHILAGENANQVLYNLSLEYKKNATA